MWAIFAAFTIYFARNKPFPARVQPALGLVFMPVSPLVSPTAIRIKIFRTSLTKRLG
jgi:hypothetical protein